MAIITPALGAARASLNKRFPNRDRASDGWIGDTAHQGTRSGHNPDETGNPEYEDSDNLDEVRAVDLDDDLRDPNFTMQDVVDAILATPRDRDRCSYLIYNRRIWSRSANYQPRTYTGSNPHTSHLHISGRPVNDHDNRPWLSIESLGSEELDMDADEVYRAVWKQDRMPAPAGYTPGDTWQPETVVRSAQYYARRAATELAEIKALVATVAGRDPAQAVRDEMVKLTGLLVQAVREAVPEANQDTVEAALRSVLGELDEG